MPHKVNLKMKELSFYEMLEINREIDEYKEKYKFTAEQILILKILRFSEKQEVKYLDMFNLFLNQNITD